MGLILLEKKSFFDLDVTPVTGKVSGFGQVIPVVLKWQNTLPDKIVNNRVEVTLSGNALDRTNVTTGNGGFYQSVDNKIFWDKNTTNILASLFPGDSGQVAFNIASLPDNVTTRALRNPHIDLHVVMTGDRSGTDSSQVSSTENMTIKISSTMSLLAQSFRDVGPFSNTGPIPPKADNESTYTITWTMTNTTNDLKDAKAVTTLPVGVTWKGQTSPGNERVTYDANTRVVTWSAGAISAGVGFSSSPRAASFKVGIVPSINQIGSPAFLTSETSVTAADTYTEKTIGITVPIVTTKYSDPNFTSGKEVVVK